jgi:hypothetical protein
MMKLPITIQYSSSKTGEQQEEERRQQHAAYMAALARTQQLSVNINVFHPQVVVQPVSKEQPLMSNKERLLMSLELGNDGQNGDVQVRALEKIRAEREMIFVLEKSHDSRSQSMISSVMHDSDFQRWFQTTDSQILVVNGMDPNGIHSEAASPLTHMCAMFCYTMAELQFVYPIAFFCRLHMDPGDVLHGASGLLRSLIAQLLLSKNEQLDLTFLSNEHLEIIKSKEVNILLVLLERILERMGPGIVVCMIDGAVFFENESNFRQMEQAMRSLNALTSNVGAAKTGLVFKLLVTNPVRSEHSKKWFPGAAELNVPEFLSLDAPGISDFDMVAGQGVSGLEAMFESV